MPIHGLCDIQDEGHMNTRCDSDQPDWFVSMLHVLHIIGEEEVVEKAIITKDRGGWPASLPYIRKICVSVAIGTQSGIRLHERVPIVKIWGSSKNDQRESC